MRRARSGSVSGQCEGPCLATFLCVSTPRSLCCARLRSAHDVRLRPSAAGPRPRHISVCSDCVGFDWFRLHALCISQALGRLRLRMAAELQQRGLLALDPALHFLWVTGFPLFERNQDEGGEVCASTASGGRWPMVHALFSRHFVSCHKATVRTRSCCRGFSLDVAIFLKRSLVRPAVPRTLSAPVQCLFRPRGCSRRTTRSRRQCRRTRHYCAQPT